MQSIIDLGRTMHPGDEALPTDCPGWTVLDQVAHVASTEAMVAGEPVPDVDVSDHTHVRHAFGERIEKYVESRRGRDLEEVLDELEERLEERLRVYHSGPEWAEQPVQGPFGTTSWARCSSVRIFDIWIHEQDIREALDRPGGLDTPRPRTRWPALRRAATHRGQDARRSSPATPSSSTSPARPSAGRARGSRSRTARRSACRCSPGAPRSTPTSYDLADDVDPGGGPARRRTPRPRGRPRRRPRGRGRRPPGARRSDGHHALTMATFSTSNRSAATVTADVEAVWDVLTDPALVARLTPFLQRVRRGGRALGLAADEGARCSARASRSRSASGWTSTPHRIDFTHDPAPGADEAAGVVGWYALALVRMGRTSRRRWRSPSTSPSPVSSGPPSITAMKGVVALMGQRFSHNLLSHLGATTA